MATVNHSQRQKQRRIPKWSQLIKTPVPAAAAVSKTAVCPTGAVSIPEYDMEDVEELAPEEAALETGRLLKAIKSRRSIRSYKQMPVSRSYMELLLQAGRYTATARNTQGCRFIFVQEGLQALLRHFRFL